MNFYKHHLGDYDAATAHLSWDEDTAYTRLLRAYYRREKPIQDDEKYRIVRAITRAQRRAVDTVLTEFFHQGPIGWSNKRADEEIEAYQAQASTNRRIARQRTVNDSSTKGIPNQEPRTKNQKASTSSTVVADPPNGLPEEKAKGAHQRLQLAPGWWNSREGILEAGAKAGVTTRPGEEMHDYKNRIFAHIKAEKAA
jgi:uncharacterized protein YdaU (DUF1376 family)